MQYDHEQVKQIRNPENTIFCCNGVAFLTVFLVMYMNITSS